MTADINYDDPAIEEAWCEERRSQVVEYLARQQKKCGLIHGEIGEWPAWHVAPYVSLWAVESVVSPGSVGWWVICGDLPTDYVSSKDAKSPRAAIREISANWKELASKTSDGSKGGSQWLDPLGAEERLQPLLALRANLLSDWANDDSIWTDHGG